MALGKVKQLKDRARELKREIVAIYLTSKDPCTPLMARIVVGIVIAYALSPIDLVPDFIPVLGLLDDLILVPPRRRLGPETHSS